MRVIRIKYSLKGKRWMCQIVGEDSKDAIQHLREFLKAPIQIMETEDVGEVHALSSSVMEKVLPKEEPGSVKCDICGKEFKNQMGLNVHKKRIHGVE